MLSTLRERRAARLWARGTGGWAAGQAMEDYQLAATELALVHLRAQRQIIAPGQFEQRRRDLLRLMAVARSSFFRRQPEPPRPPWAVSSHSGFAAGRPGPAHRAR